VSDKITLVKFITLQYIKNFRMIVMHMLKMKTRKTYQESKFFLCSLFYEYFLSNFLETFTPLQYTVWNIFLALYQMLKTGCHISDLFSQPILSLNSIKSVDHVKGWACSHNTGSFTGTLFNQVPRNHMYGTLYTFSLFPV
jgi:hypothetical protein